MTITQTIDIPADRRITVPREVPTGATIIQFTPASSAKKEITRPPVKRKNTDAEEAEIINRHAEELNREAMDVLSYQVSIWDPST